MGITVEQKVGFFFLMTIIVLAVMIELVQDWRPFEDQFAYHAFFQSSVGLKVGDPVRLAGVEIGKVRDIGLEGPRVRVDFHVNQENSITQETTAQIRQTNLLGGVFLGLEFGRIGSSVLPPGSEVATVEGSNVDQLVSRLDRNQERILGPLGDLVEESREPLESAILRLEKIMSKIDSGEGTLGRLVNDPSLYDEIVVTASRLNQVLARIEDTEGTLGKLIADPSLYDNLNQTMVNMADISGQLKSGQGTLGRLLTDDTLYNNAAVTLNNLNKVTDKLNRGEGSLGKLLNDDTLYNNVNDGVARINSIAAKIDNGQGTIGRLVNDDDLYREAKTTLHKVEKSVDGFSDNGPLSALGVVLGTLF